MPLQSSASRRSSMMTPSMLGIRRSVSRSGFSPRMDMSSSWTRFLPGHGNSSALLEQACERDPDWATASELDQEDIREGHARRILDALDVRDPDLDYSVIANPPQLNATADDALLQRYGFSPMLLYIRAGATRGRAYVIGPDDPARKEFKDWRALDWLAEAATSTHVQCSRLFASRTWRRLHKVLSIHGSPDAPKRLITCLRCRILSPDLGLLSRSEAFRAAAAAGKSSHTSTQLHSPTLGHMRKSTRAPSSERGQRPRLRGGKLSKHADLIRSKICGVGAFQTTQVIAARPASAWLESPIPWPVRLPSRTIQAAGATSSRSTVGIRRRSSPAACATMARSVLRQETLCACLLPSCYRLSPETGSLGRNGTPSNEERARDLSPWRVSYSTAATSLRGIGSFVLRPTFKTAAFDRSATPPSLQANSLAEGAGVSRGAASSSPQSSFSSTRWPSCLPERALLNGFQRVVQSQGGVPLDGELGNALTNGWS